MKKCIVVLGIVRSGTSALAGILNIPGVYFGNKLKPADKWNPKGNFEHNELSLANQAILKSMDSN